MKNKLLFTYALRNIRAQKISYLSIIIFTTLAISVFVGPLFGSINISKAYSDYCDEKNVMDLTVYSELLITDEDISAINSIPGVELTEGLYRVTSKISTEAGRADVVILSKSAYFDTLTLIEGDYPWNGDECIIEKSLAEDLGIEIGDTIYPKDDGNTVNIRSVYSSDENASITSGFLNYSAYTVTGIAEYPEHIYTAVPYPQCIFINKTGFDDIVLSEGYMGCLIRLEDCDGLSKFSTQYLDKLKEVSAAVSELSADRYSARYNYLQDYYDDALDTYADYFESNPSAYTKMLELGDTLALCEDGDWIIDTLHDNPGYMVNTTQSSSLAELGPSFSLGFVIVGIIATCAIIHNMVRKQRGIIGDMKANGFRTRDILFVFVFFSLSAFIIGGILGLLIGNYIFESIINTNYARDYLYDPPQIIVPIVPLVTTFAMGIGITVISTSLSSISVLRQPVVDILRNQDSHKAVYPRGIFAPGRRFSFGRIILRNMYTDRTRILVQTASVALATMVIIMGFSIRFSIENSMYYQETFLTNCDVDVRYDNEASDADSIKRITENIGGEYIGYRGEFALLKSEYASFSASLRVADLSDIQDYLPLLDSESKEPISDADGLIITTGYAKNLKVSEGDTLTLKNEKGRIYEARVAAIYECCRGTSVFITPEYYEKLIGKECISNGILVKLGGYDIDKYEDMLKDTDSFQKLVDINENTNYFHKYIDAFTLIIVVMTAFAIVMGCIIIINLTNIQISRREKELFDMQTNGFTFGELVRYLGTETIFISAIGIALGTVMGYFSSKWLVSVISNTSAQFIAEPLPIVLWCPVLIMVAFSICIYSIAYSSLRTGHHKGRF